jgi:hypothetical protein
MGFQKQDDDNPGVSVDFYTKAEEMYHPETFGRSGTDFVKVE